MAEEKSFSRLDEESVLWLKKSVKGHWRRELANRLITARLFTKSQAQDKSRGKWQ